MDHFAISFAIGLALLSGCAGPRPRLFPIAPLDQHVTDDGLIERWFDTNGSGHADYVEQLGSDGRVSRMRLDLDGDGSFESTINWPPAEDDGVQQLVIILDSIPFEVVREARLRGRFRLFNEPARLYSPFPVMTDPCLTEFFGISPCPAVQALHYDGRRLTSGLGSYFGQINAPWTERVNYFLTLRAHGFAYMWPHRWYEHELGAIQSEFLTQQRDLFIGYAVGTSGLGAQLGRDGHATALVQLDRLCQWLVHHARGKLQITLMSDHGHDMRRSELVPLDENLERAGYRVTDSLSRPEDVVVPAFGVVTCAVINTQRPAVVARDTVGFEGIELTMYRDQEGDVLVLSRDGEARISRSGDRYRYESLFGDPLRLTPVIEQLAAQGAVDEHGFIDDDDWFRATVDHLYPDAVHRLWRAFDGLFIHTPDVLVSFAQGYHHGDQALSELLDARAAHGDLRASSSIGFAMTTAGSLPAELRIEDLRKALQSLGFSIPDPP